MILAAQEEDVFENPRFYGVTSQEVGEGFRAHYGRLRVSPRLARRWRTAGNDLDDDPLTVRSRPRAWFRTG
jgi:hypothetical protein